MSCAACQCPSVVALLVGAGPRILPQLLSTSFSCHSCWSQFAFWLWVYFWFRLRRCHWFVRALDLREDVEEYYRTDVHEADDHDGVRIELQSIGLTSEK